MIINTVEINAQPLFAHAYRKVTHELAVNFDKQCRSFDNGNEGVLLTAHMDNTKVLPICFYYSLDEFEDQTSDGINRYPKIDVGANRILTLTNIDGTTFEVNGKLQQQSPNSFVEDSFETGELFHNGVRFHFSQFFISHEANCDVWALDNLRVAVEQGNCSRVVLNSSFDADPT